MIRYGRLLKWITCIFNWQLINILIHDFLKLILLHYLPVMLRFIYLITINQIFLFIEKCSCNLRLLDCIVHALHHLVVHELLSTYNIFTELILRICKSLLALAILKSLIVSLWPLDVILETSKILLLSYKFLCGLWELIDVNWLAVLLLLILLI